MLTRARAVILGIAALTLAGCGNIHPGGAATVDGRTISMKSFETTAEAYCALTLRSAAQQGATTVSNADVRRQAITDMVSLVVARKVAALKGVTPKPQRYELTSAQQAQIDEAFTGEDADAIGTAIENSQEISAIAVALGAQKTGLTASADNESDLAQTGQAEIIKAFRGNDVSFAPRFGLTGTLDQKSATGSLSVANVDFDQPTQEELPAAQRCS